MRCHKTVGDASCERRGAAREVVWEFFCAEVVRGGRQTEMSRPQTHAGCYLKPRDARRRRSPLQEEEEEEEAASRPPACEMMQSREMFGRARNCNSVRFAHFCQNETQGSHSVTSISLSGWTLGGSDERGGGDKISRRPRLLCCEHLLFTRYRFFLGLMEIHWTHNEQQGSMFDHRGALWCQKSPDKWSFDCEMGVEKYLRTSLWHFLVISLIFIGVLFSQRRPLDVENTYLLDPDEPSCEKHGEASATKWGNNKRHEECISEQTLVFDIFSLL